MSGDKTKKEELEERGRNVVTRTNKEELKKAAEKKRKEKSPKPVMLVSVTGKDITPREIFGGVIVPHDGVLKDVLIHVSDVIGNVELTVHSHLDAHKRRDSFEIQSGSTKVKAEVDVKQGTVLKFSVDFKGEELEEVIITGVLQLK